MIAPIAAPRGRLCGETAMRARRAGRPRHGSERGGKRAVRAFEARGRVDKRRVCAWGALGAAFAQAVGAAGAVARGVRRKSADAFIHGRRRDARAVAAFKASDAVYAPALRLVRPGGALEAR
jgi:hypothetical protein